jgi:anti-anti-sigma factor
LPIFPGVDYVDAAGLGALVTAWKTILRDGGDLELAAPTDEVPALFELTQLDTLFRLHNRAPERGT